MTEAYLGVCPVSLRKLLVGEMVRLRHVQRFSTCRVGVRESVAEHLFYATFYTYVLALDLRARRVFSPSDVGSAVRKALVHDLEEGRTGDLPRPFKHRDPKILSQINAVSRNIFVEMLHDFAEPDSVMVDTILNDWDTAKDQSRPGRLVKFADFLSVLSYVAQEVRASNNTMLEHVNTLEQYVGSFSGSDYDFVRPYVREAEEMIRTNFKEEEKE